MAFIEKHEKSTMCLIRRTTVLLALTLSALTATVEERRLPVAFSICAQRLATALQALAEQADLQILFNAADVGSLSAPGVSGAMSTETALKQLLAGTNLESVRDGDVVVVRDRAMTRSAVQTEEGQGGGLH